MTHKKVLIIDDSEADQFLAKAVINGYDPEIDIIQAYDGEDALKLIKESTSLPHLIFLDINMPCIDGFEFLAEYSTIINKNKPDVMMLTSSEFRDDFDRLEENEYVKDYIVKPLTTDHIKKAIHIS